MEERLKRLRTDIPDASGYAQKGTSEPVTPTGRAEATPGHARQFILDLKREGLRAAADNFGYGP